MVDNSKEQFFMPPSEANIFYPTAEEFQNPIAYIAKIRPIAETMGICKIKPPSEWKPPFSIDVDNLKFIPRIQKLNELDAQTRIKLNFIEKIGKFWNLQGRPFKIPIINGTALDIYRLYKIVQFHGGYEKTTVCNKWAEVSVKLFSTQKYEFDLQYKYKTVLLPFEQLKNHKVENDVTRKKNHITIGNTDEGEDRKCLKCNNDNKEQMVVCGNCDDGYHIFCLKLSLETVPIGEWCCSKCLEEECSKPMEAFGFEQAKREYTLVHFGEMADKFKMDYFQMANHEVPSSVVEKEYWSILSSIEEDITVEYGADLHAMDHGSGFPTHLSKNLQPEDRKYAESPWNLNKLPMGEGSILKYITTDVSGITIPWMYVGMCFSTFCWHSEDHWTYSINYLHWGEPKTWYAVPGRQAEHFEQVMKSEAFELFDSQPDLLDQLVTTLNPNIIMAAGVQVYRTDQQAGEFVITFPRAYHAGFNQGFNFAEAVNFAPVDWITIGRASILHYSKLRRYCVFSHDELICKMASNPADLTVSTAGACYNDMLMMVCAEKELRKSVHEWGVRRAVKVFYEDQPDDKRQCHECHTTCFLSALSCLCSEDLVCLKHFEKLCKCPVKNKTLNYRYSLNELHLLLVTLKSRVETDYVLLTKIASIFNPNVPKALYLNDLKALLYEANKSNLPKCDLLKRLNSNINRAQKIASIILRINNQNNKVHRITIADLESFIDEIDSLVCLLEETKIIKNLLIEARKFEKYTERMLSDPLDVKDLCKLENYKKKGYSLGVDLPNLPRIVSRIEQLQWLQEIDRHKSLAHVMDMDNIKTLIQGAYKLHAHPLIYKELTKLKELLKLGRSWEKRAKNLLASKQENALTQANDLFQEASGITCYLPSEAILYEATVKATDWLNRFNEINSSAKKCSFELIENLVLKAKTLALKLPEVGRLEEHLKAANDWRENAVQIFLQDNSNVSLRDVLTPRTKYTKSFEYKKAVYTEIAMIKNLRGNNISKSWNFWGSTFCLCSNGSNNIMIECELCKDWFHTPCVKVNFENNAVSLTEYFQLHLKDYKFLCPSCKRSKRPHLIVVLELINSLHRLKVMLPEGEALEHLVERALEWQSRAKKLLIGLQSLPLTLFMKNLIKETIMEGDLLEISIDEKDVLWRFSQNHIQEVNIRNFNSRLIKQPELEIIEKENCERKPKQEIQTLDQDVQR